MSEFIKNLAKTDVGRELVKYLKDIEIQRADIRNLNGVSAEVRIDALKIWREDLLDKLLAHSGELQKPDINEHL